MSGYIKFESPHFRDARWLDAVPAAFVLHAWALDYCSEQKTNGFIPTKVALRLNCPVEPAEIPAAWANLVDLGFWEDADGGYLNSEYLAHGLDAEEQTETQAKWAADKRRRRLCGLGNHQLCTARSKCPAPVELRGQVDTSTGGQADSSPADTGTESTAKWTTRPDQTRPEPRRGDGSGGNGGDGPAGGARSAVAPRGTTAPPRIGITDVRDLTDEAGPCGPHTQIIASITDEDRYQHRFHWIVVETILGWVIDELTEQLNHTRLECGCYPNPYGIDCGISLCKAEDNEDQGPQLEICVPVTERTRWERRIKAALKTAITRAKETT